jgi:hypothetical protein
VAEIAQFVHLVQVIGLFQEVFGEIDDPKLLVSLRVFEDHADLEFVVVVAGVDKGGDNEEEKRIGFDEERREIVGEERRVLVVSFDGPLGSEEFGHFDDAEKFIKMVVKLLKSFL